MIVSRRLICPYLPAIDGEMDHRCLTGQPKHSPEFYLNALQYGQALWLRGHAGRAILALTRALYADLNAEEPIFHTWPLPYAAFKWIVTQHPSDDFPGNPRVSFQHQATRLRGDRQMLRRSRAWAVWALIRQAKPALPGDPSDRIQEPTYQDIGRLLELHGHPGEAALWRNELELYT